MKTKSTQLLATLGDSDIKNLTSQVKETIFFNFGKTGIKNFTSAGLWNIHRGKKYSRGRKFYQNA